MNRFLLLLALVLLCSCAAHPRSQRPPSSGRFNYHLHQIFVPASVNGTPVGLALIDTGATIHAIDEAVAARLGIGPGVPSTVEGTAGTIQARRVILDSVSIFEASSGPAEAAVYDLRNIATPDGKPVALIVGYPLLRNFAVEIDYSSGRLTLHPESVHTAGSVPMRLDNGIPEVDILINNQPFPARIDTGASLFETPETYLNITSSTARALASDGQDLTPAQTLQGNGVGGPVTLNVIRLSGAALAGRTLAQPWAIIQPEQGVFADAATPGFIANYTLESFGRVVLDYLGGTVGLPSPEDDATKMSSD